MNIHYQDEHLLVVDKPPGMLTVPGRGPDKQDCLINRLKNDFPTALIVHRLDMATSGLLIIALSKKIHRELSELFAHRRIDKQYSALVHGLMMENEGEINLPLICDWPNRPKQKIDFESGKASLTKFKVRERCNKEKITRVQLTPVTGRSHQLRVHLLAIGHPILGDRLYTPQDMRQNNDAQRMHLHAEYLCFEHPATLTTIKISSPAVF